MQLWKRKDESWNGKKNAIPLGSWSYTCICRKIIYCNWGLSKLKHKTRDNLNRNNDEVTINLKNLIGKEVDLTV